MTLTTNIAFAGLTAAGKTTHAKMLAEDIGYDYVSATDILLDIIGINENAEEVWFTHLKEIQSVRDDEAVDRELETRLLALAAERQRTVFDTWALAWISETPLVRIWIESDVSSRVKKCFVSQQTTHLDLAQCGSLIKEKDNYNRDIFLRRHRFDLFRDRHRYDAILCNSHLIPEATAAAAESGISTFGPIVLAVATSLLTSNELGLRRLRQCHKQEVHHVERQTRSAADA